MLFISCSSLGLNYFDMVKVLDMIIFYCYLLARPIWVHITLVTRDLGIWPDLRFSSTMSGCISWSQTLWQTSACVAFLHKLCKYLLLLQSTDNEGIDWLPRLRLLFSITIHLLMSYFNFLLSMRREKIEVTKAEDLLGLIFWFCLPTHHCHVVPCNIYIKILITTDLNWSGILYFKMPQIFLNIIKTYHSRSNRFHP